MAIAVDSTSVYWTTIDGSVTKIGLAGGSPVTLVSGQSPQGIAVDANNVYWTNTGASSTDGKVMKVPLGGGTPITLASGQNGPSGIAADRTSVYWVNYDITTMGNGAVMRVTPK
jgi:DNA-binding beta-propeller fold protein YncE